MLKIMLFSVSTVILFGIVGCRHDTYVIYCLPLEANFYMPPNREYIMKYGKKIETGSLAMVSLFDSLLNKQSSQAENKDMERMRILLVRKSDKLELYITADKKVIVSNKMYDIGEKNIDDILNEIGCSKQGT